MYVHLTEMLYEISLQKYLNIKYCSYDQLAKLLPTGGCLDNTTRKRACIGKIPKNCISVSKYFFVFVSLEPNKKNKVLRRSKKLTNLIH